MEGNMPRLRMLALSFLMSLGMIVTVRAQGPALKVTAPTSGNVINASNVTVSFQVAGFNIVPSTVPLAEAGKRPDANRPGEGHLHIMLDLQPVIVWERSEKYILENVPAGEHQLMVELVNNDHSSLSPPVVQHIRFRTAITMPETGQRFISIPRPLIIFFVMLGLLVGGKLVRVSKPGTRIPY